MDYFGFTTDELKKMKLQLICRLCCGSEQYFSYQYEKKVTVTIGSDLGINIVIGWILLHLFGSKSKNIRTESYAKCFDTDFL